MIDIMENKVLGPAIRQGIELGLKQGRHEAFLIGLRQGLEIILKSRFGSVPRWVSARIEASGEDEIEQLIAAAVSAPTLGDIFR